MTTNERHAPQETVVATDGARTLVATDGAQKWVPNDQLPDHLRQQIRDRIDAFMTGGPDPYGRQGLPLNLPERMKYMTPGPVTPRVRDWAHEEALAEDAAREAAQEQPTAEQEEARHAVGARVFLDEERTGQKYAGTVTEEYGDAVRIRWDGEDAGSDSVLNHESVRPLPEVVEEAHAEALEEDRDRQSTRHTTVEVTQEESDALWASVEEHDRAKAPLTARGEALQEYSDREVMEGSDTYAVATDEEVNEWANGPDGEQEAVRQFEERDAIRRHAGIRHFDRRDDELKAEAKAQEFRTWEDGYRGNGWTWHAEGGWRHEAPKAEERTAEEVAAQERQLARTRELREDDDGTCDY